MAYPDPSEMEGLRRALAGMSNTSYVGGVSRQEPKAQKMPSGQPTLGFAQEQDKITSGIGGTEKEEEKTGHTFSMNGVGMPMATYDDDYSDNGPAAEPVVRTPGASPNVTGEAGGASGISADYVGSYSQKEGMDNRTQTTQYGEPGHEFMGGYQRWRMLLGR